MSTVLRVYGPAECDAAGIPLGWEASLKATVLEELWSARWKGSQCVDPCGTRPYSTCGCYAHTGRPIRCRGCGHPMSDGTWEREGSGEIPYGDAHLHAVSEGMWLDAMRERGEDRPYQPVHWSPCDEGCRHGGPGRVQTGGRWRVADDVTYREGVGILHVVNGEPVEASWRQVDVRTLGWGHDLRPGSLAVLCLRCWAERS